MGTKDLAGMRKEAVAFVAVALIVLVISHLIPLPDPLPGGTVLSELTSLQEKYIDISLEMIKFAISTALLLLAATGYLIKEMITAGISTRLERGLILASTLFGIFALFFSYEAYGIIAEMLGNNFLQPESDLLHWYRQTSIYSLYLGFTAIGLAAGLRLSRRA